MGDMLGQVDPPPVNSGYKRDNKVYTRVPITFLLYHYYRVGGPPKVYVGFVPWKYGSYYVQWGPFSCRPESPSPS